MRSVPSVKRTGSASGKTARQSWAHVYEIASATELLEQLADFLEHIAIFLRRIPGAALGIPGHSLTQPSSQPYLVKLSVSHLLIIVNITSVYLGRTEELR